MKEEIPPEYLWEDSRGLELWWADVTDKRDDMYGSGAASQDRSEPEMVENDLARVLKSK